MQPVLFDSEEWAQIIAEWGDTEEPDTLDKTCTDEEEEYEAKRPKEIEALLNKAEQGDPIALYNLVGVYTYYHGALADEAEIFRWWQKAFSAFQGKAEQGDRIAQYNLGVCYTNGYGCPADLVEAVRWWHKSAEQGFDAAQCCLGYCYAVGYGGLAKNLDYAKEWTTKAALQGDETAVGQLEELLNGDNIDFFSVFYYCFLMPENDTSGLPPLCWAILNGCFDAVEWLIKNGADIDAVDCDGETPLHSAAKQGSIEALEFLLNRGARTDLKDNEGNLPIDIAETEKKKVLIREAEIMRAEDLMIPF